MILPPDITPHAQAAAESLRNPDHFQWYILCLLAAAVYAYIAEYRKGNYDAVLSGLLFITGDFIWEICNSLLLHATGTAPLWSVSGPSACTIVVGVNAEILILFSFAGLAFGHLLPTDRTRRMSVLPEWLTIALLSGTFCMGVEIMLNRIDVLHWDLRFWGKWPHLWSIYLNYTIPFVAISWAKYYISRKARLRLVLIFLIVDIAGMIVFSSLLHLI